MTVSGDAGDHGASYLCMTRDAAASIHEENARMSRTTLRLVTLIGVVGALIAPSQSLALPADLAPRSSAIAQFLYKNTPPIPVGAGLPSCTATCSFLWSKEQALDPSHTESQDVWREIYLLNKRIGLFAGFHRVDEQYGITLNETPSQFLGIQLGQNTNLWVGVERPRAEPGTSILAWYNDVGHPLTGRATSGASSVLVSPTFGWGANNGVWTTALPDAFHCTGGGPPPRPGPTFEDYYRPRPRR
jgi:hypothetical protein